MRLMTRIAGVTVAVALAAPLLASPPAHAADVRDAEVTMIHGIPKVPVDVYVDGKRRLRDFTFGKVSPEIAVTPGTYAIAVRPYGARATSKPILAATEKLTAGENATVVAGLSATGKPDLTFFTNPTSTLPNGMARVIVRHVADAPAIDVFAGRTMIVSHLLNPASKKVEVSTPFDAAVRVDLAGTTTTVIGPFTVTASYNWTKIIYAIGSSSGKTLEAVVQAY